MRVVDLSHPISAGMPVYPGDPAPGIDVVSSYDGVGYMARRLCIGSHTGTHMDAPAHMIRGGKTLDWYPVGHFTGRALVVDASAQATIGLDVLLAHDTVIPRDGYLLLKTGWYRRWGSPGYFADYPALSAEAAAWIANQGLRGIGVDAPSVDPGNSETYAIHRTLLGSGMVILESLTNLEHLSSSSFTLAAYPLPLDGADGSPVRAVALLG